METGRIGIPCPSPRRQLPSPHCPHFPEDTHARRLLTTPALAVLLLWPGLLSAAEPRLEKSDLFEADKGGHKLYRIPGLVATAKGTVLAYCEGRKHTGLDWDDIEILLRRSTDGGKTWSDPQTLPRPDDEFHATQPPWRRSWRRRARSPSITPRSRVLEPGTSGYSDLAVGPDGTIYCFYECGSTDGKDHFATRVLTLARFNLEWLSDGKDQLEKP